MQLCATGTILGGSDEDTYQLLKRIVARRHRVTPRRMHRIVAGLGTHPIFWIWAWHAADARGRPLLPAGTGDCDDRHSPSSEQPF